MPQSALCGEVMRDLVQARASFAYDHQPAHRPGAGAAGPRGVELVSAQVAWSSYVYDQAPETGSASEDTREEAP